MIVTSEKFVSILEGNSNIKAKIVGKFVRNRDIQSFLMECLYYDKVVLSEIQLDRAIELVEKNRVLVCKTMNCNGNKVITGIARIPVYRDLEEVKERENRVQEYTFGEMMVIGKIVSKGNNKQIIGYEVLSNDGKIHNINKKAIVKLVKNSIIRNMDIVHINGKDALKGIGISLNRLVIKEGKEEDLETLN